MNPVPLTIAIGLPGLADRGAEGGTTRTSGEAQGRGETVDSGSGS